MSLINPVDLGFYQGPEPDIHALQEFETTLKALVAINSMAQTITEVMRFKSGERINIGQCTDQIAELAQRGLYWCKKWKEKLDTETYSRAYKVDSMQFKTPEVEYDTQGEGGIPALFTQETPGKEEESRNVSHENSGEKAGEVYTTLPETVVREEDRIFNEIKETYLG